jgi:hypothetical protein
MAKGGGSNAGENSSSPKLGKNTSAPTLGYSQLAAGPGFSKTKVNTKGPASGTKKAARSLPQGRKGKK